MAARQFLTVTLNKSDTYCVHRTGKYVGYRSGCDSFAAKAACFNFKVKGPDLWKCGDKEDASDITSLITGNLLQRAVQAKLKRWATHHMERMVFLLDVNCLTSFENWT